MIIDISSEFNGVQRTFTLQRQGDIGVEPLSIEKGNYGVIDLAANLLVVIDGVLQTPSIDYSFNGGTQITFSEAPKSDYSCQIFFYKGSQNDTSFIDVDPPLEIGDKLELSIPIEDSLIERQEARTIVGINSSNSVRTTTCLLYTSPSPRDVRSSRMPSSA